MDKQQIMDKATDFIDLRGDVTHDFHQIRPSDTAPIPAVPGGGGEASSFGFRVSQNYGSMDSFEPAKVILEKNRQALDSMLMSGIDQMMKKHTDKLLHALEGIAARLTQLETREQNRESSVDDLKVFVENYHGSSDGKMRQLENILREVQTGVQVIRDKQEILESRFQLVKLQVSPPSPQTDASNSSRVELVQPSPSPSPSLPVQPFQQPPHGLPPQSMQAVPIPNTPPPPASPAVSQPNLPLGPPVQVLSQFPVPQVPPAAQGGTYFPLPGHGQIQEAPNQHQQYQLPFPQLPAPPPAVPPPSPHQYPPHTQPPSLLQAHLAQPHPGGHPMTTSQPQLVHRAEESRYLPSQTFQPNVHQPPPQQYYGGTTQIYQQPPTPRSSLGFSPGHGIPSGPHDPSYGGVPQYGSGPSMKSQQHPQGGGMGSGYSQLPTARILPQALPTATPVAGGSESSSPGNRVSIDDDIVDKVTSMGFSRDQVRATVRRLTENRQKVELNIVLDKLMNDMDIQPIRGLFRR